MVMVPSCAFGPCAWPARCLSALGLQRALGLGSYQTAWTWLHKLRRAMVRPGRDRLTGRVEVDETDWGAAAAGAWGRRKLNKAERRWGDGRRPRPPRRRDPFHGPARHHASSPPRLTPRDGAADARTRPPGAETPLGALIDAYLQDYQVRQFRSLGTARGRVAHLAAYFGRDARAAALTTYQMRQYQRARRAAGAATGTINRETSALHRMFTLGVHWGWLKTVPGFPDRLRENPPARAFSSTLSISPWRYCNTNR